MVKLDDPDVYEAGEDKDAQANYKRLVNLVTQKKWLDEEVRLANWLREVYRNCEPLNGKDGFVPGGSLVFNGANIRLCCDDGDAYSTLKNDPDLQVKKRTGPLSGSSHASDEDQFEIQLNGAGVFLCGVCLKFPNIQGKHSWIQSERHAAMGSWGQNVAHGFDYVTHVSSKYAQVGSFGESPYSEKDIADGKFLSGRKANPLLCQKVIKFATVSRV